MASYRPRDVYERIGRFLLDQKLDPNPVNYAFAFHVVTEPASALAAAVAKRTAGGVRLTQRDLDTLAVSDDARGGDGAGPDPAARDSDALVAQTQIQVADFADIMTAMQSETRDFGRDLAASVDAIHRSREHVGHAVSLLDDVSRITATMIGRVHAAEQRLDEANNETRELRQMLEQARGDALRDPLTSLPNRRAFEEAFAAALAEQRPTCVAICDVDHFKAVNDRFGHAVGDRVLRAIAQALTQACEGHLVARYGGEEFAVLYYGMLADATATVEIARQQVAEKRYRLRETDAPLGEITFSAGVTPLAANEEAATAFQRADQLLYAAKAAGRNRVLFDGEISD